MIAGHAVVLGWAGSQPRQLRPVAAFYASRGLSPLVVAPRVFRAMASPWGWSREGRTLASRLVEATERAPGPIVVHAFSNAGFWTYAAMLRALRPEVLAHIRALVLDSAPGFPARLEPAFTARHSAMAMMPSLLGALGKKPALTHPLLDAPLRAFMRLWYHLSPLQIRAIEASLGVVRDRGAWPILALCSEADALVPIEHVDAFVASTRRARALRFHDSAHVQHMIVHRRAYFDALQALLAEVVP